MTEENYKQSEIDPIIINLEEDRGAVRTPYMESRTEEITEIEVEAVEESRKGRIGREEELKRENKLERDFWMQYSVMEKKIYLASTLYVPLIWISLLFLPLFFIIDCQDGHQWVSHIIEGLIALGVVLLDLFFSSKFKLLVTQVLPPGTEQEERLEKLLTNQSFLDKIIKFMFTYTPSFAFYETLAAMSYYDIYTDICFMTIAYASNDHVLWVIALVVMTITSAPRFLSYAYFQYKYYTIPPLRINAVAPEQSGNLNMNINMNMNMNANMSSNQLTESRPDTKSRHERLFNLLYFLRVQELKGFSEPLSKFASNHKVFEMQEFKKNKYANMICLIWKSVTEDFPQLTCQLVYVILVADYCTEEGSEGKISPIVIISICLSIAMSVAFTLLALYNASPRRIFYAALLYRVTLDEDMFRGLQERQTTDNAIFTLSKVLPKILSLQQLNLRDLGIGDLGAKALGEAFGKAQHIREVYLTGNQIGDEGAEALRKGVEVNWRIEHIDLTQNNIGERGLSKIINFHMKSLYLTNSSGSTIQLEGKCADMYTLFECMKRWKNPRVQTITLEFDSPEDFHTSDYVLANLSSKGIINLLKNGSNLEELHITGLGTGFIHGQMCEIFGEINNAQKLHTFAIMEVTLTPKDMNALYEALPFNENLHTLTLVSNRIGEIGISTFFRGMAQNDSIQTLNILKNNFGDSAAEEIAKGLSENFTLEKIFLEHNKMTDKGARLIQESLIETQSRNFNFCLIDEPNVKLFPLILKANTKRLRYFNKSLREKPQMFPVIRNFVCDNMVIQKLNLSNKWFNYKQMEELCPYLCKKPRLKSLILDGNDLDKQSTFALGRMAMETQSIRILKLGGNSMSDEVMHIIQGILINKTILVLDLSMNGLTKFVGKKIGAYLSSNTQLQELDISSNLIGDTGIGAIGDGLATNFHLKVINLSDNNIKEEGAIYFAKGFSQNIIITHLDLSKNECHDRGIMDIANVLSEDKIMSLNFSNNEFGLKGIIGLSKFMLKAIYLEYFNIENNTISDNAIEYLKDGIVNDKTNTLKFLNFSDQKESTHSTGKDKISHKGGKLLEIAIERHTGIEEILLAGHNIPHAQIDLIQELCQKNIDRRKDSIRLQKMQNVNTMKSLVGQHLVRPLFSISNLNQDT